jgi:RNA polymerase sigma-70 factor (ECF subfamily)
MASYDRERFERHVLPHLDAAYNLARWLTRDAHDAEDVVQDACMRAMRYLDAMRDGNARAWFLTIVRHATYDWLGRNRPSEVVQDDGSAIAAAVDHMAIDPAQAAVRNAEARALADAAALFRGGGRAVQLEQVDAQRPLPFTRGEFSVMIAF